MNVRGVLSFTGLILYMVAITLLLPSAVAWFDGDPRSRVAYSVSVVVVAGIGAVLRRVGTAVPTLHRKDALGIVGLSWGLLGLLGALPLFLDGAVTDPAGAVFEAVSGFTTTGATVVGDVDGLSRATNLWRCLMHWVGGMGVVVLFVAVFPQLGVGGKQLFKTEVSGLPGSGLRPRVRDTAMQLWWIYTGLTALCALLLWAEGMALFDAVCHALSTLGSGGFSTRTASIGAWDSPMIQWTIAAFMAIAGVNFSLYYVALSGRVRDVFRDAELRFYLVFNAVLIAGVVACLAPTHALGEATVREAAFQVLSVTTTTGFMTADFDSYPELARALLFGAMFVGGCAGSTAGGLKAVRVVLLAKVALRQVRQTAQPRAVLAMRLGRSVVPESVVTGALVFVVSYLAVFMGGAVILVATGEDLVTAASASIACLASVGPGLAGVGPSQNYAAITAIGKLALCGSMIAGRLEIFALFALLHPEAWRR